MYLVSPKHFENAGHTGKITPQSEERVMGKPPPKREIVRGYVLTSSCGFENKWKKK
jgi:hypothetical protein